MTSFGYRLNPRYAIKECLSCGALYTRDFCCSKGNVEDKILVPKLLKNCARCVRCGHPVDGSYCQGCALLRKKLKEDLDHGVNSSQNPPHVDECCYKCGDALDGIFCQQCTCKSCGKGAHIGYNCPSKVSIISNPEPCNQTMNNELPQTLPSFDPTCYLDKENSVPCVSKPNLVDEFSNIFNPPPQPPIYSCAFCGSNAQYGHYCTPQVPFINPEPGYSQDFNFPQDIHDFQQQYLCCDQCGGPHDTFQCQQVIFYEPCGENCRGPHENFQYQPGLHETFQCQPTNQNFYNSSSSGFDQTQPSQFPVIHPPPQETSIEILHDQENAINSVQTFLKKFNCYSFFETPKVLLLAWDRVFEIKDAFGNKQYKPKDMQELFRKLFNNVKNIHEELAEYINTPAKDHFKIVINSNDDIYSSDDDSLYNENIEYVEASPHDSEVVSLEVAEIAIPEDEEIEDDNLREKLLNVNLLIAKIEALKVNPTPSSVFLTKSSSTSLKFFLEVTNTFHNSLPEFENFCFDLEEISSGSTTTHSNISLSDYEAFYFFPPTDRSDFTHEEFADKLAHIISPPEYDCFYFRNFPDPGKWIPILNSRIRKNLSSTTHVSLPVEDDHSPLLVYVVWIFLGYLTYPVIPPYLHSFRNEDTIFDPGITINRFYSFKLGLSHRCGTFKKFNTHRSHLNESSMEMLFSTCFPMDH
nr:hypothetical protein [Tanacetum cinerariifolium]